MKKRIAMAISGGVDSLVAAFLLLREGHDVFGIHFVTGFEDPKAPSAAAKSARTEAPLLPTPPHIQAISEKLGIPVSTIDISERFQADVVDYFTGTYAKGLTPNPCLVCNPCIKFGLIMDHARKMGADALGTGHYARIRRKGEGRIHLVKGVDTRKDQSYFLSFLTPAQLERACFPLGEMTKTEVRELAQKEGLLPADKGESQDICFIPEGDYARFLSSRPGFIAGPGPITTVSGETIGEHGGLHRFTVGQRKGINCPAKAPYYVVRLDARRNRLVVGFKEDLLSRTCSVTGINWIAPPPKGPVRVWTRLRYRHKEAPCTLVPRGTGSASMEFDEPLSAITPGQGAVFYQKDEVLGAGWITPS